MKKRISFFTIRKQYHNKIANHVVFKGKTEYDYEIWKMNVGESNKDIWINE